MKKKLLLAAFFIFFPFIFSSCSKADSKALKPIADTWTRSDYPSNTYATHQYLFAGVYSSTSAQNISLLKFDLSSIPAGSTITGAKLRLYLYRIEGASSITIYTSRAEGNWEENVDWSMTPAVREPTTSTPVNSGTTYHPWDVTSLVQGWFNGTYPNHGFIVYGKKIAGVDSRAIFFSKDAPGVTGVNPELYLVYNPPAPTNTPTPTYTPTPTNPPPQEPTSTPTPTTQITARSNTPTPTTILNRKVTPTITRIVTSFQTRNSEEEDNRPTTNPTPTPTTIQVPVNSQLNIPPIAILIAVIIIIIILLFLGLYFLTKNELKKGKPPTAPPSTKPVPQTPNQPK